MTEIRSIHGIPQNEMAGRGALVASELKQGYLPYLSLTAGEMRLALLAKQARIYAAAFPELQEYRKAITMIDNALNAGISRGVSFVGALDGPLLQQVALEISRAARNQKPASTIGLMGRDTLATGINAIPVADRYKACLERAKNVWEKSKCLGAANIEQILNGGIDKCGHHMLYKNLRASDNLPTEVTTKKILQQTGIEGLAAVGNLEKSLMYDWVETAILEKNTTGGVGPYSSRQTSFMLGGREGIGVIDPVTAALIIKLVTLALAGAISILKLLRSEKAYAMAEARGFGTDAYSAKEEDWIGSGSSNNDMLLLGGAAVAAYLLLSNDK